jgi:hypothetical protein
MSYPKLSSPGPKEQGIIAMDFAQLITHLGEAPESPALAAHFLEAKVTKQPRPAVGEDTAYVQFPAQGYEMRFDLAPDGGSMFLSSITAYVTADATHERFSGDLPLGISLQDRREDLIRRLGQPDFHNKIFFTDLWRRDGLDYVVRCDKSSGSIKIVQINVPKK